MDKESRRKELEMRFETDILPVPIREGVVVLVQGLPLDLTEPEAKKIGAVIRAMADSA